MSRSMEAFADVIPDTQFRELVAPAKAAVDNMTGAASIGHLTKTGFAIKVVCVTLIIVVLFTGFIAVFFFCLASQVEKNIVQSSTVTFVGEILDSAAVLLPPATLDQFKTAVARMPMPSFKEADETTALRNAKLKRTALTVLIGSGIGVLVLVVILFFSLRYMQQRRYPDARVNVHWPSGVSIVAVAATCFLGVGLAELFFLFFVIAKYKPLDGNAVKKSILNQLMANIQALPKPQR